MSGTDDGWRVTHRTYGLLMRDELWRASCDCGWHSEGSPDLAEQTDVLHAHLRAAVVREQRPGLVSGAVSASVLGVVDHGRALGVLTVCLAVAGVRAIRTGQGRAA